MIPISRGSDLFRPRFRSLQHQIPICPETGPTCPESDAGLSKSRRSSIRFRSFQNHIPISAGSDLSGIRCRSLQEQDRYVQNQIPIFPETRPTCPENECGPSESGRPRKTGPTCPEYDSDLPWFRSFQNQIPISPEPGPTCPESDSGPCKFRGPRIRFRSFRKWGSFAHKEIPNSVRFRSLRKQGRPAQNQIPALPISDVPRPDIDLSENGADLSRKRFRFLQVPIFPVSDSDLSRNRTDLSRIRFPSCQKQGRPAKDQIPASPNPNFPESARDLSETRGRAVQNQIPIRPDTRPVLRPGRFFRGPRRSPRPLVYRRAHSLAKGRERKCPRSRQRSARHACVGRWRPKGPRSSRAGWPPQNWRRRWPHFGDIYDEVEEIAGKIRELRNDSRRGRPRQAGNNEAIRAVQSAKKTTRAGRWRLRRPRLGRWRPKGPRSGRRGLPPQA